MREYIIDAFNLFHKIPSLKNSAMPHAELVQYIIRGRLTGSLNNKVTIIFDGHEANHVSGGGYRIVYSGDRKADDIIKEIVKRSPKKEQLVVVSDDNEVANFAKMEGAVSQRTGEFLRTGSGGAAKPNKETASDDRGLDRASMTNITKELEKLWVK